MGDGAVRRVGWRFGVELLEVRDILGCVVSRSAWKKLDFIADLAFFSLLLTVRGG